VFARMFGECNPEGARLAKPLDRTTHYPLNWRFGYSEDGELVAHQHRAAAVDHQNAHCSPPYAVALANV
jgi:hypothetical protein